MSKTNCINCGAAKDTSEIKCPFCGTTYLDLTAIDFSSDDPVVCQFVMPNHYHVMKRDGTEGRVIMSMLAKPSLEAVITTEELVDVYGGACNARLASFPTSRNVDVSVSFKVVARDSDKKLIDIIVE